MANIAVLGAGVVGLSTAVNIQERLPTARVTIIADKFDKETTSAGAGGIFCPRRGPHQLATVSEETARRWIRGSFNHYDRLAHSPEAAQAGIFVTSGYELYHKPIRAMPTFHDIVYDCRECTQRELQALPVKYPYGLHIRTVMIECRRYLPWLMTTFRRRGGKVVKRKIENLDELVGHYDVVVNCTGYGSRQLLGDEKLHAHRGQAMRVSAPWVKSFYVLDYLEGTHQHVAVLPCFDTVLLGVTKQLDDAAEVVRRSDADAILNNCVKLVPSLKDAPVVGHWVGIRPHRESIRLESEIHYLPTGTLKMVHNYGHGGMGISLGWSTALEATDIVEDLIKQGDTTRASKL